MTIALAVLSQGATGQGRTVGGLVRGPDGKVVAGAEVRAIPLGPDVVGLETGLPGAVAPVFEARTDERGEFRIDSAAPCRVLIRHRDGLGALVPRVHPGAPVRVTAAPMAEIRLPPGAHEACLRVTPAEDDGWLGRFDGEALRVPAGSYRVLAGPKWSEHFVNARGSDIVHLFAPARPAAVLRTDADRVVVDGWEGVPLRPDRDGRVAVWPSHAADDARELRLAFDARPGATAFVHVHGLPAPSVAPPALAWRAVECPARGARVVTLVPLGEGARCVAASRVDDDGVVHVPVLDGAVHVLVGEVVAGFTADANRLDPPVGGDLVVQVLDERGAVADAVLELSGPLPHVRRRTRTDARGWATFRGAPRSAATLEMDAREHWAPARTLRAADVGSGPIVLRAEPGGSIAGKVTLAGRPPGPVAVSVTLRDPTGVLGTLSRHVRPEPDGSFAVQGLDPLGRYTLFATAQVDGVTWSAKLHGILAGTDVHLDLRSEDVPPPGR